MESFSLPLIDKAIEPTVAFAGEIMLPRPPPTFCNDKIIVGFNFIVFE